MVDAKQALLEGLTLRAAHHVCQLRHRLTGLRLLAG